MLPRTTAPTDGRLRPAFPNPSLTQHSMDPTQQVDQAAHVLAAGRAGKMAATAVADAGGDDEGTYVHHAPAEGNGLASLAWSSTFDRSIDPSGHCPKSIRAWVAG